MLEKRVRVYLDAGATIEHALIVKDEDDYVEKIKEFWDVWYKTPPNKIVYSLIPSVYIGFEI